MLVQLTVVTKIKSQSKYYKEEDFLSQKAEKPTDQQNKTFEI